MKKILVGRVFVWWEAGNTAFHRERQSRPFIPCWGLEPPGCHIFVLPRSTTFSSKEVKAREELNSPQAWSSALLGHLALLQPGRPTGVGVGEDFLVCATLMAALVKHRAIPALGGFISLSSLQMHQAPCVHTPHSAVTRWRGQGDGAAPPPLSFLRAPPSGIHQLILFDEPERMFQECFIPR